MRENKLTKKALFLVPLFLLFPLSSCIDADPIRVGGGEHLDYVSEYTEEEHIVYISELTRINAEYGPCRVLWKYGYQIREDDIRLKGFTVEIVYSIYDNDPEYFLVQMELEKAAMMDDVDIPTGIWYIGMIKNDDYYRWEDGTGKNPYVKSGNGEAKKYYGSGYYAVDTGDGVLREVKRNKDTNGWDLVALTEDEKSTYGKFNDPCGLQSCYTFTMQHVDYYSLYPERTHVVNLSQTTEKLFQGAYCPELGYLGEMNLESYSVETMYSIYDNDPEYCLIQVNLQAPIEIEVEHLFEDELWYIILIQNEKYYIFDYGYGLNPYAASGFGESVKYHAFGHYAVQTGENELTEVIQNAETGVWERHVLTDAEKRIYGQYNDATDCDLYYTKR